MPMTSRVNLYSPLGIQNAVTSWLESSIGIDQYCLSPSAVNLYLKRDALYTSVIGAG